VQHAVAHEADDEADGHDDADAAVEGEGAGLGGRKALGAVDAADDAEAADGGGDHDRGEDVVVFAEAVARLDHLAHAGVGRNGDDIAGGMAKRNCRKMIMSAASRRDMPKPMVVAEPIPMLRLG